MKETRTIPGAELRVEQVKVDGGEHPTIFGYAAMFNAKSEDLGGFREIVRPGAFKKSILESDIRALFNHDSNKVLGRNKSGTLRLKEDEKGLAIEIDPPKAMWAEDLLSSIRRGDIDQTSFGFRKIKDSWSKDGAENIRDLHEVQLFDVSPCTFPAYPQTAIAVRSVDIPRLQGILIQLENKLPMTAAEVAEVRSYIETLKHYLESEPANGHSEDGEPVAEDHSAVRMYLEAIAKF